MIIRKQKPKKWEAIIFLRFMVRCYIESILKWCVDKLIHNDIDFELIIIQIQYLYYLIIN